MAEWDDRQWQLREIAIAANKKLGKKDYRLTKSEVYDFIGKVLGLSTSQVARVATGKRDFGASQLDTLRQFGKKHGVRFDVDRFSHPDEHPPLGRYES